MSIPGQPTGGNAKAVANHSSNENNRPRGFDHAGDLFLGLDALRVFGRLFRILQRHTHMPKFGVFCWLRGINREWLKLTQVA